MSTKQVQDGKVLTLTAPSGGVTSGLGYVIGSLFVVAVTTAAEAASFAAATEGVFVLAKTSAEAWAEGDKIYWDAGNARADNVATVGQLIGVAAAAAANPSSTGQVKLLGNVPDEAEGPQAAIADLTMGTNVTAATANGSLEDSAATNPSEANFNNNMKELGTKINAILAVMRTKGDIAAS
jgi:predicted RecA/RadA family phage recombinase